MKKTEIIKASEFGLEKQQVGEVDLAFSEKVKERKLISKIYGEIIEKDINKDVAKEARELRLKAVKIKSGINSIHKTQKEFSLAFGKYCDAWKRKEIEPIQQMIDQLMEIEKFEEIQEQERLIKLQKERVLILSEFVEEADQRDLSKFTEEEFEDLVLVKKKQKKDKIRIEKEIEEKRIQKEKEDKIEKEKIEKENEKLKKEAEERERLEKLNKERKDKRHRELGPYLIFIRNYNDIIELEEIDYKKKLEIIKKSAKEHWDFEEEKRLKLEKEDKIRADDLKRIEEEKLENKRKEEEILNRGDKEKVEALIEDFDSLKNKYSFKSSKNKKMYEDVESLIDKIINHINK